MNYTWMGNGYAWDFFLVSAWLESRTAVTLLAHGLAMCKHNQPLAFQTSSRSSPGLVCSLEWWRPTVNPTQADSSQALLHRPQVPLCVSVGSLILCGVINAALQRWWKQPAVRLRYAPACPPLFHLQAHCLQSTAGLPLLLPPEHIR